MRILCLKKNEDHRIQRGHQWVFSNEVDTEKSPLSDFAGGEDATLVDAKGNILGSVTVNPATLICARIHSRQGNVPLDAKLLRDRLESALLLRQQRFSAPFYRVLYGEGDFTPGVVLDRYGEHISIQLTTLAMERRKEALLEGVSEVLHPKSILFVNDLHVRDLEGLPRLDEYCGEVPKEICLHENDCTFLAPLREGQKTGWFYDQRDNRLFAAQLAKNRTCLDAFCYAGGFGTLCAKHGAKSVHFLDSSESALSYAERNFQENAPKDAAHPTLLHGNAMNLMQELIDSKRHFGLVNIDPPAFIKKRKDIQKGLASYRKLNHLAVRLVEDGGILVSSSCSFHLHEDSLLEAIVRACQKEKKEAQILGFGRQGIDHPMLLSMPETKYLKTIFVRILSR